MAFFKLTLGYILFFFAGLWLIFNGYSLTSSISEVGFSGYLISFLFQAIFPLLIAMIGFALHYSGKSDLSLDTDAEEEAFKHIADA